MFVNKVNGAFNEPLVPSAVSTVAPIRNTLIAKGMLYSPAHGDTAFTVPLFDDFLQRVIPVR